ncbi:MAG TPA: hypothetical protein VEA36_02005 [Candidatus Paceibacterota bacterium]|nr:hypothetical protein [Candidatus Paceibacterota bacterium]
MTNDTSSVAKKPKLAPDAVCAGLSHDVHAILSVCIHQFTSKEELEECFDVDAVISGRSLKPKVRYEHRITPASWSSRKVPVGTDRPYTAAQKGSFIPRGYCA